ncbi:MAG TPA: TetR/AcrR family transcriptional regulator [Bacteroidales bacterium]|nr:TetR/AcrR family transcriptional regulator [Bacteroidales bacterium]
MGIAERKEREKMQRRQLIIDSARDLFFEKGIENVTMDAIAGRSELGKGTLYLYFSSKEDIQYEIALQGTELLKEKMLLVIDPEKSGVENLLSTGWCFINFAREQEGYFHLFMMFQGGVLGKIEIPKDKIDRYFREQSPFTILIELVKNGVDDGSLRSDLPVNDMATTLWSQMMGLLMVHKYKKEIYDIFDVEQESVLETNFEIILNGVRKGRKGI